MAGVTFKNITISYDAKVIIDNLSLEVDDGECFAILGPSACGKTTLMRALCGFKNLDSGQIYIGDKLVGTKERWKSVAPEKRNVGVVFQDYAVWPHYSVFENVYYPLKKRKVPKDEAKKRALDAIEQVRMKGYEQRMPAQLSGGQQQRVALAQAWALSPQVLFLDEPTASLDPHAKREVEALIATLADPSAAVALVFASHNLGQVKRLASRVIYLEQGRVMADLPVNDFFGGALLQKHYPQAHLFVKGESV